MAILGNVFGEYHTFIQVKNILHISKETVNTLQPQQNTDGYRGHFVDGQVMFAFNILPYTESI